ncbi:MAG: hypothetical protein ACRDVC_10430 [Acidimicrobiales bacterium]
MQRFKAFWTTERVFDTALVAAVIFITVWELHPNLIFSSTLLTGGDTGSHLAAPAYLRSTGNPFNFTPWDPGWFAGFPLYTYYFVLPDVLATFGSYLIGFAVAFKLATVLGSVLTPVTAYSLGRLFRAPRPIPVALALATLPFLFTNAFTIDGGNLFSSMAGEYAFSLSLALALLTIGLFARGMRTGRGFWLAAIALTATLAAHVLPWLFTLGAIALLLVFELLHRYGNGGPIARDATLGGPHSRPHRFAVGVGLGCLAFVPFFFDTAAVTNQSGFLSIRESPYSLIFTVLLALFAVGRIVQLAVARRGWWFTLLGVALTALSFFVAVRFALASILVMTAFELFQRHGRRSLGELELKRGDYSRPVRFAIGAGAISIGLSAWWLFPFSVSQSLTDSLGYTNVPVNNLHQIFSTLGWYNQTGGAAGDRWIVVLAGVSVIVAFAVRDRLGMVLAALTVASFWTFVLDPQSAIWNQRLIPFWYISIYLVSGWMVGYFAWRWAQYVPRSHRWKSHYVEGDNIGYVHEPPRERELDVHVAVQESATAESSESPWRQARVFWATCFVALVALASTVPGLITPLANDLHLNTTDNQVASWAQWNYSGYQAKASWPEYHELITTMSRVAKRYGCGRAMWEYSATENRFGTPEALMLLPYWTDNCVDSMEGLLMESSPTTPYHYLDQAELSLAPSNPQVGLNYGPLNVALGVAHLQMLGVKYYMAFSPAVVAQAQRDPDLKLVATTKTWPAPGAQWRIYLIKDSPMVQALSSTPNVVANISSQRDWLSANEEWWLDPSLQDVYAAETGPATWPRASSISTMTRGSALRVVTVTHVHVGLQSLTFRVSRVGVPMLVKISYYPRWHVTGATGPYRVSPNLMVVVPTSKNVNLNYTSAPALSLANVVSDATVIVGLVVLYMSLRRRRRPSVD